MVGPLERRRLAGLGAAAEIPGLPGHDGGQAGHARRLAGVGDRVDGLGRRDGEHQVDRLVVDQILGELAGARRIGLRVLVEDLDAVFLAAKLDAVGQRLAGEVEHVAVGLAEAGQRPGARADEADLEAVAGLRECARAAEGKCCAAGRGSGDELTARQAAAQRIERRFLRHGVSLPGVRSGAGRTLILQFLPPCDSPALPPRASQARRHCGHFKSHTHKVM